MKEPSMNALAQRMGEAYRSRLQVVKLKGVRIKIPPSRLPKPLLSPTKEVRIGETVKEHEIARYLELNDYSHEHSDKGRAYNERCRPYTPEEDEIIMRMYEEGQTNRQIGLAIRRPPNGIKQHINAIKRRESK